MTCVKYAAPTLNVPVTLTSVNQSVAHKDREPYVYSRRDLASDGKATRLLHRGQYYKVLTQNSVLKHPARYLHKTNICVYIYSGQLETFHRKTIHRNKYLKKIVSRTVVKIVC